MKKNIIIVVLLIVAIVTVMAIKNKKNENPESDKKNTVISQTIKSPLPRLLELGSKTCVPCKMMEPVLDELRTAYGGQLKVDFVDVKENIEAGEKYKIRMIPTQIFYNADGKELFRHEGFFPREDILAKWKELGVTLVDNETEKKNTP